MKNFTVSKHNLFSLIYEKKYKQLKTELVKIGTSLLNMLQNNRNYNSLSFKNLNLFLEFFLEEFDYGYMKWLKKAQNGEFKKELSLCQKAKEPCLCLSKIKNYEFLIDFFYFIRQYLESKDPFFLKEAEESLLKFAFS